MKFYVYETWSYDEGEEMEFNTIEELTDFVKDQKGNHKMYEGVIISFSEYQNRWEAEIYCGYRE